MNHSLDPSIYIARFVALLEFGEDEGKIKADSIRIATRFKEDWIHEGRRTAGICGASIYLAAQMNNYRRTIQEIVQVCKIADTTILKRLEEFSSTASANLTVGDFRVTERPTAAADPPAFTRAREAEKEQREGPGAGRVARRGKKRRRGEMEGEEGSERSRASSVRHQSEDGRRLNNAASEGTRTPREALVTSDILNRGIFEGVDPLLTRARSQTPLAGSTRGDAESVDSVMNEKDDDTPDTAATEGNANGTRALEELEVDPAHVDEVRELIQSQAGQMVLAGVRPENEAQREGETAMQLVEEDDLQGLDEEELDNYICDEGEAQMKERVWTEFNLDYLRKLAGRQSLSQPFTKLITVLAKRFKDQTGEDLNPKKVRATKRGEGPY